jgi:hypothetical protein
MLRHGRGDPHAPHRRRLSRLQLDDLFEAAAAEQVAGADRRHDRRRARERRQRAHVEMVAVDMRDQDRVEAAHTVRHRDAPGQMRQPRAQQRVGQQPRIVQPDEHGRVTEPAQGAHGERLS